MALSRACLLAAIVLVLAESEEDSFRCRSTEPQYVTEEEVAAYCKKANKSYPIQSEQAVEDLVRAVRAYVTVIHAEVASVYRQNVTWNAAACQITSYQFFVELNIYCIFKDQEADVTHLNPDYKPLGPVTRVYDKCEFKELTVGKELIVIADGLSIDTVKDDSADVIGQQKVSLTHLFEATEAVLERTARVCGTEKARVPKGAPQDNAKFMCPRVVRDADFTCDNSAGRAVPHPLGTSALALLSAWIALGR